MTPTELLLARIAPLKAKSPKKSRLGRPKGAKSLKTGISFRSDRGWVDAVTKNVLRDEDGNIFRNRSDFAAALAVANRRKEAERFARIKREHGDQTTMAEICDRWLAQHQARASTQNQNQEDLFDFCEGLQPHFRNIPRRKWEAVIAEHAGPTKKKIKGDHRYMIYARLHKGYGQLPICELHQGIVEEWMDAHPNWKESTRNKKLKTLKAACNWYVREVNKANKIRKRTTPGFVYLPMTSPLKDCELFFEGRKITRMKTRVTYISPEQEQTIYGAILNEEFRFAMQVCMRLGLRPSELCYVTADRVEENNGVMKWRIPSDLAKVSSKDRLIFVYREGTEQPIDRPGETTPKEIAAFVRQQMKKYPKGSGEPLFRNTEKNPWTAKSLRQQFSRAKGRLEDAGIYLDEKDVFYSCRHTFANRTLGGYWTGKQATLSTLAKLMGNTPEIINRHYEHLSEEYNDPIFEALGS